MKQLRRACGLGYAPQRFAARHRYIPVYEDDWPSASSQAMRLGAASNPRLGLSLGCSELENSGRWAYEMVFVEADNSFRSSTLQGRGSGNRWCWALKIERSSLVQRSHQERSFKKAFFQNQPKQKDEKILEIPLKAHAQEKSCSFLKDQLQQKDD